MKQYHNLLSAILLKGSYKEPARAGMPGSTSLFGYQCRYDLQAGFPILTTKKMFWKGIVVELLWFLRGDTNIKFLDEHGVTKMWHQDAYNFYIQNFSKRLRKGAATEAPISFETFCQEIKQTPRERLPSFDVEGGTYTLGDCGFQYGKVWRAWETGKAGGVIDQVKSVIESLRTSPFGRRHLISAIDPAHDKELALYWCHAMFQFNCRRIPTGDRIWLYEEKYKSAPTNVASLSEFNIPEYYLDCMLTQRSADSLLGVPFNASSYALLTHILAKVVNMVPGEFIHSFGDAHIYDNHKEAVKEQLERDPGRYPLPTLEMKGDWSATASGDFTALKVEDFKLIGYESYPLLTADTSLSTGMK